MHEVLTERRDDDVELAELLERLRAMLVQGLSARARRSRRAELEPVSLAGDRATALALVFTELLGNALEHGGAECAIELARARRRGRARGRRRRRRLDGHGDGTGLSIVRALVRDELRGTLELRSEGGLRAEVVFPA